MFGHDREPFAVDHFDVVVQKEEPGAVGLLDREIVERGKIERAVEMQQAMLEIPEICARFFRLAFVVDDNDFVIRIARFAGDAGDAAGEQIDPIASCDDDGNAPRLAQFTFHPVGVGMPIDRDMAALAPSLEMAFDRAPAGLERLRFSTDVIRGRGLAPPPMIENAGQMMDAAGQLGDAKKKIVVLRAIEIGAEAAEPSRPVRGGRW